MSPLRRTHRTLQSLQNKEDRTVDIKAEINKIVDRIKNDDELLEKFKKDPIKAVESILGVALPDDIIEKVVDGVKAKISLDKAGDILGGLKKLF